MVLGPTVPGKERDVLRTHEHLQVVRSCVGDESATFTWLALSIRLEEPGEAGGTR